MIYACCSFTHPLTPSRQGRGEIHIASASILISLILFVLSGCSSIPFKKTELVPTRPTTAKELVSTLRSFGSGKLLIRNSALFEFHGVKTPIEGVMKLDLDKKHARVVAINEMGIKLFDLSINRTTSDPLFVILNLKEFPGFTEAVATSVRRIFLDPEPSQDDTLSTNSDSYLLTRRENGKTISFLIGGAAPGLLEKSSVSPDESWKVSYFEYLRDSDLPPFPRGILLDDELAGYRLTLWLESVEKSDE